MNFVEVTIDEKIATVILNRPKVNALNEDIVAELGGCLEELENDSGVRSVILTGVGSFFSFGFDVPHFMDYPKESFRDFVVKFTDLTRRIFLFPKPVITALNGHTIAGGCMLALACDRRLMVSGKAKISLNEITFGSSVFASGTSMLKYAAGEANAEEILYSGKMYSAQDAKVVGLIHDVVPKEELTDAARQTAEDLGGKRSHAFRSVKKLLRGEVAEKIAKRQEESISQFVDIWYSESTRESLRQIEIRD